MSVVGAGRHHAERGSGTVLAVGLVGVLLTLLVAGLLIADVAIAGQRARTAADLAALAAAGRALEGASEGEVCAAASAVAARNGAPLTSCSLDVAGRVGSRGLPSVRVTAARDTAAGGWTVEARARAGGVVP
ncbi:Rv3654c family TadE-like protein [Ornithinimicrobium tianjinense]|uniref:Helicase/secretion neighborhood TadE-like protein n=1 Tax=Ornithinimicrobium tianjinense TaxID=1195761 RepID=A0A917BDD6_9MICO|nr:Rv3654c family TadE-like protein [Ornithinimicrobium tianjinense]GGF37519.1 hypothetical protein GCM10011366_01280 [Ornithinimicrobium tianjinense]